MGTLPHNRTLRIQEGATIMTPPALGVQADDGRHIVRGRLSILHTTMVADLPGARYQ
jgi:hypothetical protein